MITYEEKQKLYKQWQQEWIVEEMRAQRGKYVAREFWKRFAIFVAERIIRNAIVLAGMIGIIVLAGWAIWGMTWGIVRMCQVM